jgi:hypothetical protein
MKERKKGRRRKERKKGERLMGRLNVLLMKRPLYSGKLGRATSGRISQLKNGFNWSVRLSLLRMIFKYSKDCSKKQGS